MMNHCSPARMHQVFPTDTKPHYNHTPNVDLLTPSKLLVENCDTFVPHLCLAAPQGVIPSKFGEDLDTHKTRMNGLSCGEESMTICSAVLIQYQRVMDRQTAVPKTCISMADERKNWLN